VGNGWIHYRTRRVRGSYHAGVYSSFQLTHSYLFLWSDTLAVSAQGFRRGANRVRKVCLTLPVSFNTYPHPLLLEHVVSGLIFGVYIC